MQTNDLDSSRNHSQGLIDSYKSKMKVKMWSNVKMEGLKASDRRKFCANFYENFSPVLRKSEIVAQLVDMGMKKSVVYKLIAQLERGESLERKPGSGPQSIRMNQRLRQRLIKMLDGKIFPGYRKVGKKLGCSHEHARKLIKEAGINIRNRRKCPKTTVKQDKEQKTAIRKLRYAIKGKDLIIDDESYFDVDGRDFSGSSRYAFQDISNVSKDVMCRPHSKFPAKIMIWIAISSEGHSVPYFKESKGAIDANIYIEEALKKRLIPFLKHHSGKPLFWPDKASCHYAKRTLEFLANNSIDIVEKQSNPTNAPQLRPIETFWSHLKAKVYANGYQASSIDDLIRKIKKELKTFSLGYFQNLMKNIKKNIIIADKFGMDVFLMPSKYKKVFSARK